MFVPFGRWLPDQADFNNPGVPRIENAIPVAKGFQSVSSLVTTGSTGVTGIGNNLWVELDAQQNVFAFAGDEGKLYRLTAGTFNDISRSGGYTAMVQGEQWRTVRFGDDLFAVNAAKSNLQKYNLPAGGVGGLFSDALANFQGKYITVVRDQLVLAHCSALGGAEGGTLFPYRVHWSAVGDPVDFTPSTTTLAGFNDLPDLGEIRGLTGGEFGTVLLEKGIVRFDFLGPPTVYQFDQIEGSPGCREPRSVIRAKNRTYWLSPEGFLMFDGQQVRAIGAERVDRFFETSIRSEDITKMSVVDIPSINAIAWGYVSVNNVGDGKIDSALLYNYDIDQWGYLAGSGAKFNGVDCLGTTATVGVTLDQITDPVDSVQISLDSRFWKGGEQVTAALKAGELFTFTGPRADGILETADFQPNVNGQAIIKRVNPAVQGGNSTAQVGVKQSFNDTIQWGPVNNQNSRGYIPTHGKAGRIHRVRANCTNGWTYADGVNVEIKPAGQA